MKDTKIIYHIENEATPYLIKLPIDSDTVTLRDFKNALNRPNYRFFFKSSDADFGFVKEEITDDENKLPSINGRVISWLVTSENSILNCNSHLDCDDSSSIAGTTFSQDKVENILDKDEKLKTSAITHNNLGSQSSIYDGKGDEYTASTFDNGDCDSSLVSSSTATMEYRRPKQKRRKRRRKIPANSTLSTISDSTMSLNIITVTLNMEGGKFLGISVVGQSNKGDDGGIYVGSIMKGGAVAEDGRIEPGDMLLEVNGISFDKMSNEEAVNLLRKVVQKPGPITLVVAKCWDPEPEKYFAIPQQEEPIRPIDPAAWVQHTTALLSNNKNPLSQSVSTLASIPSTAADSEAHSLSIEADMMSVICAMTQPGSGLNMNSRQEFLGCDLTAWLFSNVDGFASKADAKKYSCKLFSGGFVKPAPSASAYSSASLRIFDESTYYVAVINKERMQMQYDTAVGRLTPVEWAPHSYRPAVPPPPAAYSVLQPINGNNVNNRMNMKPSSNGGMDDGCGGGTKNGTECVNFMSGIRKMFAKGSEKKAAKMKTKFDEKFYDSTSSSEDEQQKV